jgi:hypothetical protein
MIRPPRVGIAALAAACLLGRIWRTADKKSMSRIGFFIFLLIKLPGARR